MSISNYLNCHMKETEQESNPDGQGLIESSLKIKSDTMNFMYLYNLNYTYRIRTEAIFDNKKANYFDLYFVNDKMFDQFKLYENLWRETLLMHNFNDKRVQKIKSFGQLPNKLIYHEIDEI